MFSSLDPDARVRRRGVENGREVCGKTSECGAGEKSARRVET